MDNEQTYETNTEARESDYSDWYRSNAAAPGGAAPHPGGAPSAAAKEPPKIKRKRKKKWIAVCVCAVIVLAAVALGIADKNGDAQPGRGGVSFSFYSRDKDGNVTEREFGPSAKGRDGDKTSIPDTFRDFAEEWFYSADSGEKIEASSIEKGQTGASVSVELLENGEEPLSLQALYEKCAPSVVGIKGTQNGTFGYYWGSGIVLTADGYILTNAHVIAKTDSAVVILDSGEEYPALLIGEDLRTDIAVLKIEPDEALVPAEFGDSDSLRVGDGVVAIGNPLSDQLSNTMTNGIVSAINRDITVNGSGMELIQTNAALNEGNSGGPLIDLYGHVVGITNMKLSNTTWGSVTIEGIGFAIPSATIKSVAESLIRSGEVAGRPGLGITVGALTGDVAERYDVPTGLFITEVSENSDAAEQGVQPGDILTHVNGTPVATTDDVLEIRNTKSVGDSLTLTLWRDGESFDVDIILVDQNKLN